jgi:glycerophosphoryl diester phosphodiesterase
MRLFKVIRRWLGGLLIHCPEERFELGGDGRFLVIGHRGSPARRVENTLESCAQAVGDGANGVEVDLCLTEDGHVVLWHDWDPEGTVAQIRQRGLEPAVRFRPLPPPAGSLLRRPVSQLTLADLRRHYGYAKISLFSTRRVRAHIATIEEFFAWAVRCEALEYVFLDIKTPAREAFLVPKMLDVILGALPSERPGFTLVLLTTELDILRAMKAHAPDFDYALDSVVPAGIVTDLESCRTVPKAVACGNAIASIGRPTLFTYAPWQTYIEILLRDLELMARHNADPSRRPVKHLIGWTINHPREMKCLIRLGLSGLLTDYPARLRAIASKLGKRVGRWARAPSG